jgi:hypothetical protein
MPFSPISAPAPWNAEPIPLGLYSKNHPQNINYMHPKGTYFVAPVVFFFVCLDFEKIAILGQPPKIGRIIIFIK